MRGNLAILPVFVFVLSFNILFVYQVFEQEYTPLPQIRLFVLTRKFRKYIRMTDDLSDELKIVVGKNSSILFKSWE